MKLKKCLTLLLSLTVVCCLCFSIACNKDNPPTPPTPPDPMQGVEKITSIVESDLRISATATNTATSYWKIVYGEEDLQVSVYVKDEIIFDKGTSLYGNDSIEILIAKAVESDTYSDKTYSVTVDVNGSVGVIKPLTETFVEDNGVKATVKRFTILGEKVEGYYANVSIPYDLIEVDKESKDAVICIGMYNIDDSLTFEYAYHQGIKTNPKSVKTYAWLQDDNTLAENPYFYRTIDGVKLDGKKDLAYGEFVDTVTLDDDRWYNISAVKTQSGVMVYSQGLFNTSSTNPYEPDWGKSTNFEFKLNHGNTSYVAFNGLTNNVSEVITTIEEVDGKYLHTVEFFVEKDLIFSWLDNGNVYLNYAWKTPGENANTFDDLVDVRLNDWGSTDWHARHRLGGLATATFDSEEVLEPYNLEIGDYGLQTVIPNGSMEIDGELTEYGSYSYAKGDTNKAVVEFSGKIVDGGLYLGLIVTHESWSDFDQMWYKNDNFEMKVNNKYVRIIFIDGKLIIPANVTAGASKTIEEGDKLVTFVELFFEGNESEYKVKFATCGEGFGVDFQPILWDGGDMLFVNEDGIVAIDGVLGESMWDGENVLTTTANGASLSIQANKMQDGVIFGIKVDHTKAPDVSVNGETNWWNYMGVQLHFNSSETMYMTTCRNDENSNNLYPYCTTVKNDDDSYTSIFEIYVEYAIIGTTANEEITFTVGGWFETDWAWLWDGNATTRTHKITQDGEIEEIVD